MAERFATDPGLVLAIAPEGTRRPTDFWRSGFYHIAHTSEVPIVLAFLDYGARIGGVGPVVMPTGGVGADMDRVRAFYADVVGRHPTKMGRIRLKSEEAIGSPKSSD